MDLDLIHFTCYSV